MILIWSGEGGPLQWLCLIMFCLQFFAPQLIQLSEDFRNLNGGTVSTSQYPFDVEGFPFHWIAACLLAAGAAMWIFMEIWQRQQRAQQQPQVGEQTTNVDGGSNGAATTNTAPYGSASNPVVIEDDINIENNFGVRRLSARVNSMLQSLSPAHFMLAVGFALPLLMSFPLVWNLLKSKGLMGILFTDPGMVQVSVLAVAAHSVMAIAAYRVLRDVLDSGGVGQYPGNNRQGGRRRRMRKLTVSEIADIVRKVPVEEFVSEEDIRNGDCSISRLKRMLRNRGSSEAAERCLERADLVREVEKSRNFNEECAICAEEYVEGDVLRVPICHHEFHLHCFDKWIYTFSTDSKPATHPTCPLCKTAIE